MSRMFVRVPLDRVPEYEADGWTFDRKHTETYQGDNWDALLWKDGPPGSPIELAMSAFESYAGAGPSNGLDRRPLQARLASWQGREFQSAPTAPMLALGVSEEAGELCHAVLKRSQGIRGMNDDASYLEAVEDAIADVAIFSIQMATLHRLDFWTLVNETAERVMGRSWSTNKDNGGDR